MSNTKEIESIRNMALAILQRCDAMVKVQPKKRKSALSPEMEARIRANAYGKRSSYLKPS
jgi:predicted ATPase